MSQRLCVGNTSENYYDCVLTDTNNVKNRLLDDWLLYSNGFFLGSLKVRIADKHLFKTIEPIIKQVLEDVGLQYPNDLLFFMDGKSLDSPTKSELKKWLNNNPEK